MFNQPAPFAVLIAALFVAGLVFASAQSPSNTTFETSFRIGERLTYNVSFARYPNIAYAEIYTVSSGRLGDRDAVELRSKIKTLGLVSAAFFSVDESRTTFVSPETGLPIHVSRTENSGGVPKATINNFLAAPSTGFDLLSLIYRIRQAGGTGTFPLEENGRSYTVTVQIIGSEKVKTDAGDFDTNIVSVQSEYLSEIGLKDLRINITADDSRIPALIRFQRGKNEFKASVASIQSIVPEPEMQPTPTVVQPVRPDPTPRPSVTPTPYIDNQVLAPELSFVIGETLEYRLLSGGQSIGKIKLEAKERKQLGGEDSLLLVAAVSEMASGNPILNDGDGIRTQVDPETLTPRQFQVKFSGPLAGFNQTARYDEKTGTVIFGGTNRVDVPVGTHNLLSLIYAIRSFNLKPSRDTSNPINDTRVAVFWVDRPYIFTLRPSQPETITIQGRSFSAQQISVNTGNTVLDQLGIKIWLSNDQRRLPLRISFGTYQADLISDDSQAK